MHVCRNCDSTSHCLDCGNCRTPWCHDCCKCPCGPAVDSTVRNPLIRWLIRRDFPEVLTAERLAFKRPWTEEAILEVLRDRNVIGMVVESGERVVGHMIYQLFPKRLSLVRVAVHPEYQRFGYGRAMMRRLADKLSVHRRHSVLALVDESMTEAHLFFRACGFTGRLVKTDYDGDLIEFVLSVKEPVTA